MKALEEYNRQIDSALQVVRNRPAPRKLEEQHGKTANGLAVWELWGREKGSSADLRPLPSLAHAYRFVNADYAAQTIEILQSGSGRGSTPYEVYARRVVWPCVQAITECYCEVCGVQTAAVPSERRERRLVSACKACQYKGRKFYADR